MRLGLGTAQFGMDYGISNIQGQTTAQQASEILNLAEQSAIQYIDTACLYGQSETVLGQVLSQPNLFNVTTKSKKFDQMNLSPIVSDKLQQDLLASLQRLNQPQVYGYYLHDIKDILKPGGEYLYEGLVALRDKGWVKKIGVSAYLMDDIDLLLDRYDIDIIQVPFNVFDQRLLQSGMLTRLTQTKIEVHVRSIFLQGLCLMPLSKLNAYFTPIKSHIAEFQQIATQHGMGLLVACLGFIKQFKAVDAIICGVNNSVQLYDLIQSYHQDLDCSWVCNFALNDLNYVDPRNWPK